MQQFRTDTIISENHPDDGGFYKRDQDGPENDSFTKGGKTNDEKSFSSYHVCSTGRKPCMRTGFR